MTIDPAEYTRLHRDYWFNVVCPACAVQNWWSDTLDDGDSSKLDVGTVKCRGCGKDIRLMDGEDGTEDRPHIDGSSAWDERNDGGAYREGIWAPGTNL